MTDAKQNNAPQEPMLSTIRMPPFAKQIPKVHEAHGVSRKDPYYWLKQREEPDVRHYLRAENAFTDAHLEPQLCDSLYDEMIARIKKDDSSVPYRIDDHYYYTRYEKGREYGLFCRRSGSMEADEELLLDENKLAEGCSFFSIGGRSISADHSRLAYAQDIVGRRLFEIRVLDLTTGKTFEDRIEGAGGDIAWAADGQSFFYVHKDADTLRCDRVYHHVLGQAQSEDRLIFHEQDSAFNVHVYRSTSKRFIFVGSSSTMSNEYRFVEADRPEADFRVIQPREWDHRYYPFHLGDAFFLLSNYEAPNFQVMRTALDQPGRDHWQVVIGHNENVYLDNIHGFANHLVILEWERALPRIRIIRQDDGAEHCIAFEEPVYLVHLDFNPDLNTKVLRFNYDSLTTPLSIYDYDMDTRERTLLKREPIVGDFDPANYRSERVWAKTQDGTEVPISIVYHKETPRDGSSPLLQYAYGSYGISCDPHFSSSRLSLLDRGFIFAIAHVRGGSELGRAWYEAGKLDRKWNTFDDFIACSAYLIAHHYTRPDRLFARGGSAGGMLMGVIANKRPDLYRGILAIVPFVDCLTTMQDETIPLTTIEYDEWGDPRKKACHDYILSYSPYDQVKHQEYPHMLVTTGLHDSQVQYWEPAKWVAKLRANKTDMNMLLLHTNMDAGHGGSSGRFQRFKDIARETAFLLTILELSHIKHRVPSRSK
ncbi:S9 family peptidase [Sulfidibacter corallicola]|uniref:S9 family peptidase n=1 Tax=Sulfidibacter corallicola TaxID=2818388 RepID=A0A8A4TNY9_SULCO|nr:S9 family peptidase [Sulfidibacter corallicola]QTD51686.1 S9 family peptidase [Sulfidibacter corallicola]